jgi:hypothetical protein
MGRSYPKASIWIAKQMIPVIKAPVNQLLIYLFQQTAGDLVPGASVGPVNDVARLDHPVHHTALGNVELEKIGFIEASPVLQDLEEKNECANRKCLNTKERLQ